MNRTRQSLAWWCFGPRMEPADLIATAVKIGYKGIEMAPEELWPQIVDAGLQIVTITGHQSNPHGFNRTDQHDRLENEIKVNLDRAVKWQIPCLIVFSGNRDGMDDVTGMRNTVEGLRRVAPLAEAASVTLVLELLNSKIDHQGYMCDRTAWGVEVCRQVNSPSVKLLYDIYHMQIMEGDVIRTIRSNIEHIGHIHTAGVPGRHDLDDTQELYYPAIAGAIAEAGYTGFIGQEFLPRGDPAAALEQAFKACEVQGDASWMLTGGNEGCFLISVMHGISSNIAR